MLKLQFNLHHQDIYLVNRGEVVATDSKNYLVAQFNKMTDDWETPLTAIFTDDKHKQPYAVIVGANEELEENECFVPWEVLTDECNVYVSVYCGNLHTTVTAAFKVQKSGYIDGETPPPPSPTVYDIIVQAIEDLKTGKQDKLTAGENISIENGVISAASGGTTDYNELENKPKISMGSGDGVGVDTRSIELTGETQFDKESFYYDPEFHKICLSSKIFRYTGVGGDYDFSYIVKELFTSGWQYYVKSQLRNLPAFLEELDFEELRIIQLAIPGSSNDFIRMVVLTDLETNTPRMFLQTATADNSERWTNYYTIVNESVWQELTGTSDYSELLNKPTLNGKTIEGDLTTADFNLKDGKDGKSIIGAEITMGDLYLLIEVENEAGEKLIERKHIGRVVGANGTNGKNGDGYSAAEIDTNGDLILTVVTGDGQSSKVNLGHVVGADGFSPVANVTKTGSTSTITITDKNGTTTATVSDGAKGDKGDTGAPGAQGPQGDNYVLTAQDKSDIANIVLSELPTVEGVLYGNTSN